MINFHIPPYIMLGKERAISWGKNHMVRVVTLAILVMYWMAGGGGCLGSGGGRFAMLHAISHNMSPKYHTAST
jgi:hypothetical protein